MAGEKSGQSGSSALPLLISVETRLLKVPTNIRNPHSRNDSLARPVVDASPTASSLSFFQHRSVTRALRRMEITISREKAQKSHKVLWLCAFCDFSRLFRWPLMGLAGARPSRKTALFPLLLPCRDLPCDLIKNTGMDWVRHWHALRCDYPPNKYLG
jgi:hypothetical protein